jgi:rpoB: DNA-directed RNA polymerase, beta subunit
LHLMQESISTDLLRHHTARSTNQILRILV